MNFDYCKSEVHSPIICEITDKTLKTNIRYHILQVLISLVEGIVVQCKISQNLAACLEESFHSVATWLFTICEMLVRNVLIKRTAPGEADL